MENTEAHKWTFITDFQSYPGNFVSEYTAWLTGFSCPECQEADIEAEKARRSLDQETRSWFKTHLLLSPRKDSLCKHPDVIVPTPGWVHDHFGTEYLEGTDPEVVLTRYRKEASELFQIKQRLAELTGRQVKVQDLEAHQRQMSERAPVLSPSFLGLGIRFKSSPPTHLLMTRALKFVRQMQRGQKLSETKSRDGNTTVLGFRLLYESHLTHTQELLSPV